MDKTVAEEMSGEFEGVPYVDDGYNSGAGYSGPAEMLHADVPMIRQALATEAESIRARFEKLQVYGYFNARHEHLDAEEARRKIEGSFNEFLTIYFPDGELDHQAIAWLAEAIVSKIDVVPISELMETARTLVEDSRDATIYLWVTGDKARGANWESPFSSSSNEFMTKLVQRYAALAHKEVKLVSEADEIAGHENDLCMIDDVAYTGSQIGSNFLSLSLCLSQRADIRLYVTRATKSALDAIHADAQLTRMIWDHPRVTGKSIQNLSSMLVHASPAWQYFWTQQLSDDLASEPGDPCEVLATTERFFGRETLTMLPNKVPDAVSFPSVIAQGLPSAQGIAKYPNLDELHFTLSPKSVRQLT